MAYLAHHPTLLNGRGGLATNMHINPATLMNKERPTGSRAYEHRQKTITSVQPDEAD
jgi:hypothetical protein